MVETRHYSTDGLTAGKRLGGWRDYMSTVYYSLDITPHRPDHVRGELSETDFGALGLSSFKADAQTVSRDRAAAQSDGSDNFVFLFPTREALAFEQHGRSGVILPGSVVVLNSSEGYRVDVPDRSENITLKIRCDRLRPSFPGLDDACGRTDAANPYLVPVVSHLGAQLLRFDGRANSDELQRSLLDLTCLMMRSQPPEELTFRERRSLASVTFDRAIAHLRENFSDPTLTPAKVADALRISPRYFHRVFQMQGQTYGDALMEIRLIEAHRQLKAAASIGIVPSICDITFRCGFVSQSHFATRFRQRFGATPRDLQRGGQSIS